MSCLVTFEQMAVSRNWEAFGGCACNKGSTTWGLHLKLPCMCVVFAHEHVAVSRSWGSFLWGCL